MPTEVTIWYAAPIQSLFARVKVLDRAGGSETAGRPTVGRNRRALSVKLKSLKLGNYTVKWSVVAENCHHTGGSYDFTVAGDGS